MLALYTHTHTYNLKNKKENAITLVALVITIIILLILAGITILQLTHNGLFEKSKVAKVRTEYTTAKEIIEMKLMEVQTECILKNKEYTIEEIGKNILEDNQITIEKCYYENETSIKPEIESDLANLKGIVVSVDKYSKYKFLIGKSCEIEGITIGEIPDKFDLEYFKTIEEFEKEIFQKTEESEQKEEIIEIPTIGDGVDTSNTIEIETYIAIKSNTVNILKLEGIENLSYQLEEITDNVSLKDGKIIANKNADSKDSCKIIITGMYEGQNYINHLIVLVEPKNKTTVIDKEGNEQEAYGIYNAQDLVRLQELVNNEVKVNNYNTKIMKDIDLSEVCGEEKGSWIPIGWTKSDMTYTSYKGIFDGQGYTINNLYLDSTKNPEIAYDTAFIYIEDSIFKNINFDNIYICSEKSGTGIISTSVNSYIENIHTLKGIITSEGYCIAGICGTADYSEILNCSNNINISGEYYVGGITGNDFSSKINKCYNGKEGIISGSYAVGGISGQSWRSSTIDSCYNRAEIISTRESNMAQAGGIVGFNEGGTSKVENCYNTGNVTGKYTCVGGIIGHDNKGTYIKNHIFNTGIIKSGSTTASKEIGTSSLYVGYLLGRYGSINENCKNLFETEIVDWDQNTILTNLGVNFKIDNFNKNDSLPILDWQ